MQLPLHTRAFALVAALSTTATIIVTVAEIGHPPSDGRGAIAHLLTPSPTSAPASGFVTRETSGEVARVAAQMPEP